jgi:asparagine synthase (glutamine-hydrolysing)
MCGFVAIVGDQPRPELLAEMLAAIRDRGPDDDRFVVDDWFSLGVCRLSIVGGEFGAQPLTSADGTVTIAFNGEIYDFADQARRLGHTSGRRIDSEIQLLLGRYLREGPEIFGGLDGDFAVAVFDRRTDTCFLARDRWGVKPLYYAILPHGRAMVIGSDMRGIVSHPDLPLDWDDVTLIERRVLSFSARHRTPIRQIRQVRPGHYLELTCVRGVSAPLRVIERAQQKHDAPIIDASSLSRDADALIDRCDGAINAAVQRQTTHTDVEPVVVALSGGVDSTIVAAAARRADKRVVAVTIGNPNNLDPYYASRVAQELKIEHYVHEVRAEDVIRELPRIVHSLGGVAPAYTPYFLGQAVRTYAPDAKVLLCGEGADEMFAGYWIHVHPLRYVGRAQERLASLGRLDGLESTLLPEMLDAALCEDEEQTSQRMLAVLRNDQLTTGHLVPFDHATMAFGVECRVPFLDRSVADLVEQVPALARVVGTTSKPVLRLLLPLMFTASPQLWKDLLTRIPSGAPMATEDARNRLREILQRDLKDAPVTQSPLARLAGGIEELFWLGAFEVIFISRRGRIDGMGFADLLEGVRGAGQ